MPPTMLINSIAKACRWLLFTAAAALFLFTGVSEAQIYVTDPGHGSVAEYSLTGDLINPALISGFSSSTSGQYPFDVAVSGNQIYVLSTRYNGSDGIGTIGVYNLDGSVVNVSLVSNIAGFPTHLLVSGGNIYVSCGNSGVIKEYTTAGATVSASLISGLNAPEQMAISGNNLFITEFQGAKVSEYTTSGFLVNPSLVTGVGQQIGGIVVSGNSLFVAGTGGYIGVFNTFGGPGDPHFISIPFSGRNLAIASGNLFITNDGTKAVGKYSTLGGTVNASLISGLQGALGIAVIPQTPPTITPGATTGITYASATLQATVNPHGVATQVQFQFGVPPNYDLLPGSQNVGNGTTDVPVSFSVSNLAADFTYHYRVVTSSVAGTYYGPEQLFTTGKTPPAATTSLPSDVYATIATLKGTVNPNLSATTFSFQYGTDQNYGSTTATQDAGSGTSPVALTANISGLLPQTTYHYRAAASNVGGTVYGQDQSFTTTDTIVFTDGADHISPFGARILAHATNGFPANSVLFEYGTDTNYGHTVPASFFGSDATSGSFGADLSGLARDTVYHFRFVAVYPNGTEYGLDAMFTSRHETSPVALNDIVRLSSGNPATIAVLANDTDPEGDSLTVVSASPASVGKVKINPDGTFTYTPGLNFAKYSGTDSFTYTIDDGFGGTATGTVTISNPFYLQKGKFAGPVSYPGGGLLTLTLTSNGTFSGKLRVAGDSFTFKGQFDITGHFAATIGGQSLALQMDLSHPAGNAFGDYAITGSYGEHSVDTHHALYNAVSNPAPQAGSYTVLLPAVSPAAADIPLGTGFATLKINEGGVATLSGALSDGTLISDSIFITGGSSDYVNQIPIYIKLPYKASGLLTGVMTFEDTPGVSDCDGDLIWNKPAQIKTGIYQAGFETTLSAIGSRYAKPPAGVLALNLATGSPNAEVELSELDFAATITKQITVAIGSSLSTDSVTVNNPSTDALVMSINSKDGPFQRELQTPGLREDSEVAGRAPAQAEHGRWLLYRSGAERGGEPCRTVITETAPRRRELRHWMHFADGEISGVADFTDIIVRAGEEGDARAADGYFADLLGDEAEMIRAARGVGRAANLAADDDAGDLRNRRGRAADEAVARQPEVGNAIG